MLLSTARSIFFLSQQLCFTVQLGQKYAAAVVDAADVVVVVVSGIDLTDKEGGPRIILALQTEVVVQ